MRLLAIAGVMCACTTDPEPSKRPDFLEAPTLNQRITSIRFLSDEEVGKRFSDLTQVAKTSEEAPVRDAVILRLKNWGKPQARPLLRELHRDDADARVAQAALHALRDLCWEEHGRLMADRPPAGPIPDVCTPAYDGTLSLPAWRPPPREESAAFWASNQVETRLLPSGEIWAKNLEDRKKIFARYPTPPEARTGLFDGL